MLPWDLQSDLWGLVLDWLLMTWLAASLCLRGVAMEVVESRFAGAGGVMGEVGVFLELSWHFSCSLQN